MAPGERTETMKASIALTLVVFVAVTLCGCRRENAAASKPQHNEATPVTVAVVTNVAWDRTVSIVGTLYPKDEAAIAARVEGQVEKTLVDFGDRIQTNQDLAFIDTASYAAQLDQAVGNFAKADANLANARQSFDRMQKLKQDGVASASDFDLAKAQLDQWEAELKAARGAQAVAQLNVERSRVQAPFDGGISQRFVGRGDFVHIGTPLFNLVNDAVLKFIFQVPERYASYVEKKLPVKFNVDNYPGETFTGSVYLISPAVNTTSRAFGVGALVTNTDFRLKASTFARGTLVLERGVQTPVVPLESVVSFAGVTKVYVIENNVARSRAVQVGRIRDGLQEITSGIAAGAVVAVTGQNRLTDGTAVAIKPPDTALADTQSTASSRNENR
jgi:membrane fusion protein (multidrug efflux system)